LLAKHDDEISSIINTTLCCCVIPSNQLSVERAITILDNSVYQIVSIKLSRLFINEKNISSFNCQH